MGNTVIVPRAQWGARADLRTDARGRVTWMTLPALGLYLHHSTTTVTGDPYADLRAVEQVGVSRYGYLSYSWLSHPTGVLAEGAGDSIGAHTLNRNSTSYALCLVGNYDDRDIDDAQVEHLRWLYWHLRGTGRLVDGAFLDMHRSVFATACPGARVAAQFGEIARYVLGTPNPPAIEEDDMATTCIPSWAQRDRATSRPPFYRLAHDQVGNPLVLAFNGAPLVNLPLPRSVTGDVFGVPFVTLPGLAGRPIGVEEIESTGAIVVVCEDGGVVDIAGRP